MFSGKPMRADFRFRRAALACAVLVACGLGTPGVQAQALDVATLMQRLAQHPSGRATFVETKHLRMLDAPVVSSGELLYSPPDRLEKTVLKPRREVLVVERDVARRSSGGRTQQLRLDDYPEVRALVEGVRGSLVGNRSLLERYYKLAVEGTAERWQLTLTPTESHTARWVRRIVVQGRDNVIHTIETEQTDGDSSRMDIQRAP